MTPSLHDVITLVPIIDPAGETVYVQATPELVTPPTAADGDWMTDEKLREAYRRMNRAISSWAERL